MGYEAKRFEELLHSLYERSKYGQLYKLSFSDVMKDNASRLAFINYLFKMIQKGEMDNDFYYLFRESIGFIHAYINGEYIKEFSVPNESYEDMEACQIIPSRSDLENLLKLIKRNVDLYNIEYKNNRIIINLPDESFNMNMIREMEVLEKNLAHLHGLTDSQEKDSENSNLLMKYFLKHVPNTEKYGKEYSTRLITWLVSPEGQQKILDLHDKVLKFMDKDQILHSQSYDNGKLKKDSYNAFIKRLNEEYKSEDIKFPIIKYSRWLVKSVNCANFFNMNNINEVILDYNSPVIKGTNEKINKSERDIYFVGTSSSRLEKLTENYLLLKDSIDYLLSSLNDEERKHRLLSFGIKEKDAVDFINLMNTVNLFDKNRVNIYGPKYEAIMSKINDFIGKFFLPDIHIIGFGTEYDKDDQNQMIYYPMDQTVVNEAHCDTSLTMDIAKLVTEYYRRGRAFFLDRIEDADGIIRLSTPSEEIAYDKQMIALGVPLKRNKRVLVKRYNKFNKSFEKLNSLSDNDIKRLKKKKW